MQIEIAEPGRMTLTGSSLFKSIQNNHTPILDLLVRESIQNSLDAGINNAKSVQVKFQLGSFSSSKINALLDGATQKLDARFPSGKYDFIAICDTNTVGLTGPLHPDDIKDDNQNFGNLIKLVYEISKPQTQEGAGGSWGLGKTIYFRVGMGLVFYYSRIRTESGKYESRLAATLVEDEKSKDAVIPYPKNFKVKRGIAWWGESRSLNKTCPLTNEKEINKILTLFGIEPYQEETGTIVIIPYINKHKLLIDNCPYTQDEEESGKSFQLAPWYESIEEYLKIAVQRWYIPRLNNKLYKGRYLQVSINDDSVEKKDFAPIFKTIQNLYNVGTGSTPSNNDNGCQCEDVNLRAVLAKTEAGRIVYELVSRKTLGMFPPHNNLSPEIYCNLEVRNAEPHKPIFSYTRKPGMIVSYQNSDSWLEGVPATDEDHFLIALFVLNSDNSLKECDGISLEEYVRKSELADHSSWKDHSNQKIISRIQFGVSRKLSKIFNDSEEENQSTENSTFSRILGDLLLPKIGFGKNASIPPKKGKSGKKISKSGSTLFSIDSSKTIYNTNYIDLHAEWASTIPIEESVISLGIDSENSTISANEWEETMGLGMPFGIEQVSLQLLNIGKKDLDKQIVSTVKRMQNGPEQCTLEIGQTSKKIGKSIILTFHNPTTFSSVVKIRLKIYDSKKDKKPIFSLG